MFVRLIVIVQLIDKIKHVCNLLTSNEMYIICGGDGIGSGDGGDNDCRTSMSMNDDSSNIIYSCISSEGVL